MSLDAIAALLSEAGRLAKAGQAREARSLIRRIENVAQAEAPPQVFIALGMLHYLTGNARDAVTALRRVAQENHTEASLMCLSAAFSALGERGLAAGVQQLARELDTEETTQCIEDLLRVEGLENYVLPSRAHRGWGEHMRMLAAGDFAGATAEMLRGAAALPAYAPGALSVRLRDGRKLPLWRGQEEVAHLVVVSPDGHGDTFCFGRYIRRLARFAQRVSAIVSAPTLPLCRQALPEIEFQPLGDCGELLARADCYASTWMLPGLSGGGYGVAAWIEPAAELVRAWRQDGAGLRVGLAWNGSLWNQWDNLRSIRPAELAPLLAVPGVTWHSLQIGPKAAERPAQCIDHAAQIRDFHDTAALIASLDLVISVDTAVANLAGAMGRPVWVLVEQDNDFRWGLEGEATPWFPSARVFRQDQRAEWAGVIAKVARELRAFSIRARIAAAL